MKKIGDRKSRIRVTIIKARNIENFLIKKKIQLKTATLKLLSKIFTLLNNKELKDIFLFKRKRKMKIDFIIS